MSKNNNQAVTGKMPTTEKIAFQTGAAKDDLFESALNEDQSSVLLNVLANDPGAARLYSLVQGVTASTTQVQVLDTVTLASGAVISQANGIVRYDISAATAYQHLAQGEVGVESFEYVIRMGNGALSTATATVQILGLNDAPVLEALPQNPVLVHDTSGPESVQLFSGQLHGYDVDNGAVLTYGFSSSHGVSYHANGSASVTTAYGTLTLDSQTGHYTFTVNPDALDSLRAAEEVSVNFDVLVTDEHAAASGIETIQFKLIGADEAAVVAPPDFGPQTRFVVNHGLDFINGRAILAGFDGNDRLKLAGVKQLGDIHTVDTNGDGQADASGIFVRFSNKTETVEIVLSGYLELTQAQIDASSN